MTVCQDDLADADAALPRAVQRDLRQHIEVCLVASAVVAQDEAVPLMEPRLVLRNQPSVNLSLT